MTPNHEDLRQRIQELPIDDGPAALPFVRRPSPKRPGKVLPSRLVLQLGAGTQCPVCKDPLEKNSIACPRCRTPQHSECWDYAGGCSTYSCGTRRPNDPPAPDQPPLHTYPALPALVAALVLVLIVALGYGLTKAAPRFAVPPKHDNYRPVMVPDRSTPPSRPYPSSAQAPAFHDVHDPALPSRVDRWGRPIVPDPWGRPIVPDPWGRPSLQDPEGWSPWSGQPGYSPYGPTPSQHHGFGPSPVPPWNHRR